MGGRGRRGVRGFITSSNCFIFSFLLGKEKEKGEKKLLYDIY